MIKFILTDIEGTASSISFEDLLLNCSRVNLKDFVYTNTNNVEVLQCLYDAQEYVQQVSNKKPNRKEVVENLLEWIERDVRQPSLKKLQGMINKLAYENGDISGHIYPDVALAFERWRGKGVLVGTYSSSPIEWQKLHFKFSTEGDLIPYISAFFDTGVGEKTDIFSYFHVADKLNLAPNEILFLSDSQEELESARKSGMGVLQMLRKDSLFLAVKPIPQRSKYLIMNDFDGVDAVLS